MCLYSHVCIGSGRLVDVVVNVLASRVGNDVFAPCRVKPDSNHTVPVISKTGRRDEIS